MVAVRRGTGGSRAEGCAEVRISSPGGLRADARSLPLALLITLVLSGCQSQSGRRAECLAYTQAKYEGGPSCAMRIECEGKKDINILCMADAGTCTCVTADGRTVPFSITPRWCASQDMYDRSQEPCGWKSW